MQIIFKWYIKYTLFYLDQYSIRNVCYNIVIITLNISYIFELEIFTLKYTYTSRSNLRTIFDLKKRPVLQTADVRVCVRLVLLFHREDMNSTTVHTAYCYIRQQIHTQSIWTRCLYRPNFYLSLKNCSCKLNIKYIHAIKSRYQLIYVTRVIFVFRFKHNLNARISKLYALYYSTLII